MAVWTWLSKGGGDPWGHFLERSVVAVRWLLGVQCLLSGMNWWVKILPFPNIADPPGLPVKAEIVRTMIDSGWMFSFAKGIEIALAVSLLTNRFVAAMLVISMPIILMTFLADGLILDDLFAWLRGHASTQHVLTKLLDAAYFGGAVLVMQVFLMFAYLERYRPMLVQHATPEFPK